MHVHLVFITQYRYRVFDAAAIQTLREICNKVFPRSLVRRSTARDEGKP